MLSAVIMVPCLFSLLLTILWRDTACMSIEAPYLSIPSTLSPLRTSFYNFDKIKVLKGTTLPFLESVKNLVSKKAGHRLKNETIQNTHSRSQVPFYQARAWDRNYLI